MLKKIGIGVGLLVVLFLALVAMQPSEFTVTRRTQIAAPAAAVFPLVNDFHAWNLWSPWEKLDTGMKKTFSGAPLGKGSVYEWAGNDKVGSGRMEITDSRENTSIAIKLDFITPFAASNTTTFTFAPKDGGTEVVWAMSGHNNFVSKAFGLLMNMDKMVGGDFEKGLAEMKKSAEAKPAH